MDEHDLLPANTRIRLTRGKTEPFDSGSTWAGVAQTREEVAYPADMYLEGTE
jgi:hypothetical protein